MCFSCALHASSTCLGLACGGSRCFKRVESAARSSGFITERLRCFRSFVWVSSAPTDTTPRCSATQRTYQILVLVENDLCGLLIRVCLHRTERFHCKASTLPNCSSFILSNHRMRSSNTQRRRISIHTWHSSSHRRNSFSRT